MDELGITTRTKVRRKAAASESAARVPLSQMDVSEDEIAAVEAFLGLHFATIFGHRDGKENLAAKKAANGG